MSAPSDSHAAATRAGYRLRRRFAARAETTPGAAWSALLRDHWPGWRAWYVARGGGAGLVEGERAIRRHMPEMTGLIDRLSGHLPEDPVLREFLTYWCPPRYLAGCTQAVSADADGPFLIRNYDLAPELNEATVLWSSWRGRVVMGMVEGLIGLSDGMNGNGLAVSLSFGGRVATGRGFGIPLLIRYVLETCADVRDGVEALRALPSHMSYNVTLADARGDAATVFLAPDRPVMVRTEPWATNHQLGVEWPRHGRMSATLERARRLGDLYAGPRPDAAGLKSLFLAPPFFATDYRRGFGTVFSAIYRPAGRTLGLFWGDGRGRTWEMDRFAEAVLDVEYTDRGSRLLSQRLGSPA